MEENNINIICLETKAFYKLLDTVTKYIKETHQVKEDTWIQTEEAMNLLGIKSKSTLQELRNNGSITFAQPMKKVILYKKASILSYLDKSTKETF